MRQRNLVDSEREVLSEARVEIDSYNDHVRILSPEPVGCRLAVRLYWMWRRVWDYQQLEQFGAHAGQPGTGHGVQSITDVMIERPAPR
jgi:hypothetical protein